MVLKCQNCITTLSIECLTRPFCGQDLFQLTLILSLATHDYAFQVSDRRLVKPSGELYDDHSNKAVFYCDRVAFSYTGLGFIESARTDLWISNMLSDSAVVSASDAIYRLRDKANEVFARMKVSSVDKRHAFVGVGWTRTSLDEPFRPMMCRISNFHNDDGTLRSEANEHFEVKVYILRGSHSFSLLPVGQAIPADRFEALTQVIRNGIRKKWGPRHLLDLLVKEIDEVANQNVNVGRNLLASVLPRSSVKSEQGWTFISSGLSDSNPSFLYFAEKSDGNIYGPNYVCGGASSTNFRAGPIT